MEPPRDGNPLLDLDLPNLIVTPHVAWASREAMQGFAEQLVGIFQNAYVRVEGNTDSVGSRATNKALSEKRARAVVSYLTSRHRFDPARFVAVGNGPDRPVADNKSTQGRDWNRRTDFRIVPNY